MNTNVIISPSQHQLAKGVCVVIDVLRASSVEAHLFLCNAQKIIPQSDIETSLQTKKDHPEVLLIGERQGIKYDGFDFGNSPTELINNKEKIRNKICIHNTQQGTQSLVVCRNNPQVTRVFMCSINNCQATIEYLKALHPPFVTFVASGNEITCREDLLYGRYLEALYLGKQPEMTLEEMIEDIKHSSGSKFFKGLPQFPEADFYECYKLNSINVVMEYVNGEIRQVN
ncbi:2-phosphosulfolactate phosphatase, putative [Entamoeba histolytica HM-1:IMSS-B]|uniref:2-phosphosulfolactate phosphatase n=6 Tax=Entamoeba histolytica TaxID=5759 RepID=C4LWV3_ENTH1|nr:2-phosphosulfolactate phosphatase, putative [Entamoeba histolytica HM-1:IMSS]EMD43544.1 2-phosphosulfolactate phosphatase, putative [Entamoeba histolytica KU27]EMH74659.1 2-phosphosulfolactate phosphatase, putative [Entamoeba histolytica HM-1:IMSS-B]EMS16251.1 2-phosphosulfolactate phosphatase, putative [Entamoeba histolytica HM-3:IMSS]ENY63203.1 2-phosphosulfolactate phosphatase, putative [Entamoeba histolytica HM-1:IMSS-A]GAT93197.1 2-phosphosulfolactate phosphatase putative [Entamoeba hi|eukprot:XP_653291.1 2-phosphosulfolactate phosphatase, putative [Entamoeba histolytica HM-1:IMSS]